MFARVHLDRVLDNSFQTRMVYDGIEELADSILKMRAARPETSGLIQVPPARVVLDGKVLNVEEYGGVKPCLLDEPEARVELAAGHRRFRAFQHLHIYGDGGLNPEYETFPVEIQVLDDQAMANMAWEENRRRKDLSPIEEADALKRAMERFGWTQAEIGERWGLSQSAVANKLRLLQLPEDAQAAIRAGQLSERHGRVLLKAMGKSPCIYERVANEIIPVEVDNKTVEKARALAGERFFYSYERLLSEETRCAACGELLGDGRKTVYLSHDTVDGTQLRLCQSCYRAAMNWTPPSVAEAEDFTNRTIHRQSRRLDGANFPLNVIVGDGDPLVHQAKCEECGYRDDEVMCLDAICFQAKEEHWYGYLVSKFQMACRKKWPNDSLPPVIRSYEGRDLSGYNETDKGMIESGWCSPKCEHLRFRYSPRGEIRPFREYPFIWNCNNTNRCNGCRRRYLRSQGTDTDEEQAAAKETERQAKARRTEARAFLRRAELSVSQALRAGHDGAWRELAVLMGERVEAGQPVETSALMVAGTMLRGEDWMKWIEWEEETAVGRFEETIKEKLNGLGVGMMPGTDDLVRRLERIQGFLLGEDGLPRAGLTPEQVQGNLDNLVRLAAEVEAMVLSEQDRERLLGWVRDLRELFPGK